MTIHEVLAETRRRGVVLEPHGDRLHYRARKGALTPELREAIVALRVEILDLLKSPSGERCKTLQNWANVPIRLLERALDADQVALRIDSKANGTIWIVAHERSRKANEDLGIVYTVAEIAVVVQLSEEEVTLLHSFKTRFGSTIEEKRV